MLDRKGVARLLPLCIPPHATGDHCISWNPQDKTHPPSSWITDVWKYLQQHFVDLSHFENIPLIPYKGNSSMYLLSLTLPSVLILKEYCNFNLPENLCALLLGLGVYVLDTLPVEIQSHPGVLGRYVVLPLPEDLLDALIVITAKQGKARVTEIVHSWPCESKRSLRAFLSNVAASALDGRHQALLKQLPVFETVDNSGGSSSRFVSADDVSVATEGEALPVQLSQPVINVSLPDSTKLAHVIHMPILSVTMLLKSIVFRDIANGYYDSEKLYVLMDHILNHLALFMEEDKSFSLNSLPFIPSSKGLSSPESLFDPGIQLLKDLFWDQGVFPSEKYCDIRTLSLLRKCGLKGINDITAEDILGAADQLNRSNLNEENQSDKKSLAILQVLKINDSVPHYLDTEVRGLKLADHLMGLSWLCCEKKKPTGYPNCLHWFESSSLYSPPEVVDCMNAKLVGSVRPVLPCQVHDKVRKALHWNKFPNVNDIVCHMKRITESYIPEEKGTFVSLLAYIYEHLAEADMGDLSDALRYHNLEAWLWHGEGFSRPEQIVLQNTFMDLRPYLFTLPTEVQKHKTFFLNFGIRRQCDNRMLSRVLFLIKIKYDMPDSVFKHNEITRDLQLSVDILNYLKPPDGEIAGDEVRETLLVPVQVDNDQRVKMLPLMECTYCDAKWIRQGYDLMDFSEEDGIIFIHPLVPTNTAECLGVPTLMSRMLKAEEFNITGFGQTEPLTTRLRQLTEEYTDGMSIPKELIQNADDAGATEVKFLYDERQNEEHMKYLIDEGMKYCQGPALWVYNNAEFSDQDFQNITKLGGATKDSDTSKIGRFGLGFNAVYNITDMPSFVSRSNIIIFDPHTTHLGKAIRDKPGIKIDMNKNKTLLRKLPDQFHPYQNVFGCSISSGAESNYLHGTLFRLPLRTKLEASKSKISSKSYEKNDMIELSQMLLKNLNTLLLFSQNVIKVGVYHCSAETTNPADAKPLFELMKMPCKILKRLELELSLSCVSGLSYDSEELIRNTSILKAVSKTMEHMKAHRDNLSLRQTLSKKAKSSVLLNMHTSVDPAAKALLNAKEGKSDHYWLVVSEMGTKESVDFALNHSEYIPTGAVALEMIKLGDGFVPCTNNVLGGKIFCYMPLPVQSYLPVHINGHFAVTSNRRGLIEQTEDDKYNFKVDWNQVLLKDAISSAYSSLLNDVAMLIPVDANVEFFMLWPDIKEMNRSFKYLSQFIYDHILQNDNTPVIAVCGKITDLQHMVLLDPSLNDTREIADLSKDIFEQYSNGRMIVELPKNIMQSILANPSASLIINSKILKRLRLFETYIFPNLGCIDYLKRDPLILYALQDESGIFETLLQNTPCIPVSPKGMVLKQPKELVSPFDSLSNLYDDSDERFPFGCDTYLSRKVMSKLANLGMAVSDLTWEDIIERVATIPLTMKKNENVGKLRLTSFLELIDRKLSVESTADENTRNILINSPFLPVLVKPECFPLTWNGDQFGINELLSPVDLYLKRHRYLIGSQQPMVDEALFQNNNLPTKLIQFFRLNNKDISLNDVMNQLNEALNVDPKSLDRDELRELHRICSMTYAYLQHYSHEHEESKTVIAEKLSHSAWILIKDTFVEGKYVALHSAEDCSPYLYCVPEDMKANFSPLLQIGGAQTHFKTRDYVTALQTMKEESEDLPLKDRKLNVALKLTRLLNKSMTETAESQEQIEVKHGLIYVPDSRCVMQSASALCFNDCPWLSTNKHVNYTHPDVTYDMAVKMGVTTKRQQALKNYSTALPFGQKEKLTNTLRRILNSYPCDHEIFKELLQNADDAKATEIHFILDTRTHNDEHVFSKSWKPLQGPALCVYNNKPFSKVDLEGIQNLGEGSKSNDPNKTGQYGIGFSSVYHLTDVPSLITESEDLGKILCVFDPHCKYVPGATVSEPGMLYNNLDQLEDDFPDVFPCYLPNHYTFSNSTMFRFPLRSRQMAETSAISGKIISVEDLRRVMTKFRQEALEVLLFLNNIKKIVFREINMNGQLSNPYCVVAHRAKEDEMVCAHFDNYCKKIGKEINEDMTVSDIVQMSVSYNLILKDNAGTEEHWKVIQSIGGDNIVEIPDSVKKAVKLGDLALLPRGGVACLVNSWRNGQSDNQVKPKKAFSFLPLPLESGLPFHINGHFALGFENRRQLWTNEDGTGYKDDWNQYLFTAVIAPCYVKMLLSLRSSCLKSTTKQNSNILECSRDDINEALGNFNKNFPLFSESKPYWNYLVSSIYQKIAADEICVLPVLRGFSTEVKSETEPAMRFSQWQITWHPPGVDGSNPTYFNNLDDKIDESSKSSLASNVYKGIRGFLFKKSEKTPVKSDKEIIKDVLLECGFLLVESSNVIFESFLRAGVHVEYISPEAVFAFFKSSQLANTPCTLGILPKELKCTPFKNIKTLAILLKYCKNEPSFVDKLNGLPFLVTQDEVLRNFDIFSPVFLTSHNELLNDCADVFVHKFMHESIFADVDASDSPVFQEFNIESLANLLDRKLSTKLYFNLQRHVEWTKKEPKEVWIRNLWLFLFRQCLKTNSYQSSNDDKGNTAEMVLSKLQPLSNWAIVPSKKAYKSYLVPLNMSSTLVDLKKCTYEQGAIRDVLKKLQIPELDRTTLSSSDVDLNDFVSMLVTTLSKADTVLSILHDSMISSANDVKLTKEESERLLLYFNQNIEKLQNDPLNKDLLRGLPLFMTVYGDTISLSDSLVYTLPAKIPTDDMDVWQSKSGIVFLSRNENLMELYQFLDCASMSVVDVYCQFILQHFEYLSEKARYIHLYHLYKTYLGRNNDLSAEERDGLLEMLKGLEFISDKDGNLLSADSFHDPANNVFRIMLTDDKFPPKAQGYFREQEWIDFLSMLGLKRNVDNDMCIQFAKQLALEKPEPQSTVAQEKSKALVQHLFEIDCTGQDDFLRQMSEIQFLAPQRASANLRSLSPQYGEIGQRQLSYFAFEKSVSVDYEDVVWTKANLLPHWADPLKCRSVDASKRQNLMRHLGIQEKPSVEMVVSHILELSSNESLPQSHFERSSFVESRLQVFKSVYRYLQTHDLQESEVCERLKTFPCIIVENGNSFVKPTQTVFNLLDVDQIPPYLYKVPLELGEFQHFFLHIGSTDTASADQYANVLSEIHASVADAFLMPNELLASYKAVKGLLHNLDEGQETNISGSLYLPSEKGQLLESSRLVFNDSPSYYDRIQTFKKPFLVNLKECGVRAASFENLLMKLTSRHRPQILSSLIKETLIESCHKSTSRVTAELKSHMISQEFASGIVRLLRHEHHGSHQKDKVIMDAVDNLQSIQVYSVKNLTTHLICDGRSVKNSEVAKSCFMEKSSSGIGYTWHVYISDNAALSQDVLIKVADIVNKILNDLLGRSVLYLLPILSCKTSEVNSRLNELNIREDHSQPSQHSASLPIVGSDVPIEIHPFLKNGFTHYCKGEYVGYLSPKTDDAWGEKYVYARVINMLYSSLGLPQCMVDIGNDTDPFITDPTSLFKFQRN